jgi:LDH2 family malate/lactate/ureidoglycolate dehydrogenase
MRIAIADADALVNDCMRVVGYSPEDAKIITDQVMGCELRGVTFGGLSRALSLIERTRSGPPSREMRIERETPVSALIDGGDQNGYLIAHKAVQLGIEKAKQSGIAVIGANNTWYTGMYAHYLEMATDQGLVAMAAGSSAPRVAPHGSSEGRFGTNPIAFGFPSDDQPIIFDIGTSAMMIAEVVLAQRLGQPLPEGMAFDKSGAATTDPAAALAGAIKVWGGHKGAGLALVVQMLGILVGGGAMPADYRDCGFFFLAIMPDLFIEQSEFTARISDYARTVRLARPVEPGASVRMPFDRSAATRARHLEQGAIEAPEAIVSELRRIAGRPS